MIDEDWLGEIVLSVLRHTIAYTLLLLMCKLDVLDPYLLDLIVVSLLCRCVSIALLSYQICTDSLLIVAVAVLDERHGRAVHRLV